MLLIHPPGARAGEPFPGPARLAGALKSAGAPCFVWDASLEGLLFLAEQALPVPGDTRRNRAVKNREAVLSGLSGPEGYRNFDRYRQLAEYLDTLLPSHSRGDRWDITPSNYTDAFRDPLEPGDLAAAAENPEESPWFPWFSRRIPELMKEGFPAGPPRRAGISFSFLSQALPGMALAGFLRREYPEMEIFFGGGLITSWIRRFGSLPFLRPWADRVEAGAGEDEVAPGRRKDALTHDFSDVHGLPYLSPGLVLPFGSALGCPWRKCTFCPETCEQNPYQPLGARRSLKEMRFLGELYGPVLFHITDSEISPALLKGLAEGGVGVPWYGFARFSSLLEDPQFCRRLALAGCRMLALGLESADPAVLKAMNKGIDLKNVPGILENLKAAGIGTYVYLLFGTPGEDESAALRTRDFTAAHAHLMDFISPALFNMPLGPGADSGTVSEGPGLRSAPLSLYRDFEHPRLWNRDRVRRFLTADFRGTPEIRAVLNRTPPFFTSSHAPFFL